MEYKQELELKVNNLKREGRSKKEIIEIISGKGVATKDIEEQFKEALIEFFPSIGNVELVYTSIGINSNEGRIVYIRQFNDGDSGRIALIRENNAFRYRGVTKEGFEDFLIHFLVNYRSV